MYCAVKGQIHLKLKATTEFPNGNTNGNPYIYNYSVTRIIRTRLPRISGYIEQNSISLRIYRTLIRSERNRFFRSNRRILYTCGM